MILYFIPISSVLHCLFFPLPFPTHLPFPLPSHHHLALPSSLFLTSPSLLTHEIWNFNKKNPRNTNSEAVEIILKAWMLNSLLNFHTCMPGGWITLYFQRRLTCAAGGFGADYPVLQPSLHMPNSHSIVHGLNQPSHDQDQGTAASESISEMPWGNFIVSAEWESSFPICPPKKRSKSLLIETLSFLAFLPFSLTGFSMLGLVTSLISRVETCNIPPHKLEFAPAIPQRCCF